MEQCGTAVTLTSNGKECSSFANTGKWMDTVKCYCKYW